MDGCRMHAAGWQQGWRSQGALWRFNVSRWTGLWCMGPGARTACASGGFDCSCVSLRGLRVAGVVGRERRVAAQCPRVALHRHAHVCYPARRVCFPALVMATGSLNQLGRRQAWPTSSTPTRRARSRSLWEPVRSPAAASAQAPASPQAPDTNQVPASDELWTRAGPVRRYLGPLSIQALEGERAALGGAGIPAPFMHAWKQVYVFFPS
jgi:hypothetical protein